MLLAALLFCAPLLSPRQVVAAEPEKPSEPPLFNLLGPRAEYLAPLCIGAGAQPRTGALGALGALIAGEHPDLALWDLDAPRTERVAPQIGAATLFLNAAGAEPAGLLAGTLSELALLRAGHDLDIWHLRDTDLVFPIGVDYLERIKDGKPIPDIDSGDPELDAWYEFLSRAAQTPTQTFFRAGRKDVTYAHLFNEPKKYRGEVIFLKGKLYRVRKYDAPLTLQTSANIRSYYEGWVFCEDYGANPFCILFTELPPGVEVAEQMDVPVEFAGYFYKKYRYKAGDNFKNTERRDAPLLIGHGLIARPKPGGPVEPDEWGKDLLPYFLGLIVTTAGVIVLLGWWMRRGDRDVRQRLSALQQAEFILPSPDPVESTPSNVPVARAVVRSGPMMPRTGHGPAHPTSQQSPQPSRLDLAGGDEDKPPDPSASPRPGEERVPPPRGAADFPC
jgi:hypothetical protein